MTVKKSVKKSEIIAMTTKGGENITVDELSRLFWEKMICAHGNYLKTTFRDYPSPFMGDIVRKGIYGNNPLYYVEGIKNTLYPEIDAMTEQQTKDELKRLVPHLAHLYAEVFSLEHNASLFKHEIEVGDVKFKQAIGKLRHADQDPLRELAKKLVEGKIYPSRRNAALKIKPDIIAESKKLGIGLSEQQAERTITGWLKDENLPLIKRG